MAITVEERLRERGIEVPELAAPAANYVPFVRSGDLVFVSGHVPSVGGELRHRGKVGAAVSLEDARDAARICALNAIAAVRAACDGDLERVRRCVKLGGFVNATPEFDQHPAVINGASDLMVEVFGERGRHARFAVGSASLPFDVAVEVDVVFEVE
jgi:enamine deaminase RidA (YjgF/YER057c/UK114 family)